MLHTRDRCCTRKLLPGEEPERQRVQEPGLSTPQACASVSLLARQAEGTWGAWVLFLEGAAELMCCV